MLTQLLKFRLQDVRLQDSILHVEPDELASMRLLKAKAAESQLASEKGSNDSEPPILKPLNSRP